MKRLTFDVVLAGTLAVAPVAIARDVQKEEPAQTPLDTTPQQEGTGAPITAPPADMPGVAPPASQASPVTSPDKSDTAPRVPAAGKESDELAIVGHVHELNQNGIEMAQMALEKGKSSKVKAYARKLLSDHQSADKQLMAFADRKEMDRSKLEQAATGATDTGPTSHQEELAKLNGLSGADFDRAFAEAMVASHDQAIYSVRAARDATTDPSLRSLLNGMLPKLEQHRNVAQQLLDQAKL